MARNDVLSVGAASLLSNDSDVDGDTLALLGVSNATNGAVSYNAMTQTVTFTPAANYNGVAGFDYTITNGAATATAHVTVNVTNNQGVPIVTGETRSIIEDTVLVLNAADLLANDRDADRDTSCAALSTACGISSAFSARLARSASSTVRTPIKASSDVIIQAKAAEKVNADKKLERVRVLQSRDFASLQAFEDMMAGKGMSEADGKEMERIMTGYHELVDKGRREIYRLEN